MRTIPGKLLTETKISIEFDVGPVVLRIPRRATLAGVACQLSETASSWNGVPLSIALRLNSRECARERGSAASHVSSSAAFDRPLAITQDAAAKKVCAIDLSNSIVTAIIPKFRAGPKQETAIAVFDRCWKAEAAFDTLIKMGISLSNISIAAATFDAGENIAAGYRTTGSFTFWGRDIPFWSKLWASFEAGLLFSLPCTCPVAVLGFLAPLIVSTAEEAGLSGGLGALYGAFSMLPVQPVSIASYLRALRSNNYLMIVRGDRANLVRASKALEFVDPVQLRLILKENLD